MKFDRIAIRGQRVRLCYAMGNMPRAAGHAGQRSVSVSNANGALVRSGSMTMLGRP